MTFKRFEKVENHAFKWGALSGFFGGIAFSAFIALLLVVFGGL